MFFSFGLSRLGKQHGKLGKLHHDEELIVAAPGGETFYIMLESSDGDDFLELESSTDNVLLESAP